jgi:hypothetical protein
MTDENMPKFAVDDFGYSSKDKDKNMYREAQRINEFDLERIPFGKDIIIYLPKGNITKAWEKAQRYMKLYLEDYEEFSRVPKDDIQTNLKYENDKEVLQP